MLRAMQWTAEDLRWLAAIAAEGSLPRVVLTRLGAPPSFGEGLLLPGAELSVPPEHEQPILRAASEQGILTEIADATRAILETRSVAHVAVALQCGDLSEFLRQAALRRLPRAAPYPTAAEWLRASVCAPFNAEWLERTWGTRADEIATRVLREALDGAHPCDGPYAWLRDRRDAIADDELEQVLAEHAFLRGELVLLDELARTRQGYRAAARYLDGDLVSANKLLDRTIGRGKRDVIDAYGTVAPLLALLLVARGDEASIANAKRLLATGASDGERGAARAFKALLRYLAQPGSEHRRIDVHQLDPGAGVWELLLTAFNVELHLEQPWVRASFAQHLASRALAWGAAGYSWLGKQGLLLADALDGAYCARAGVDAEMLRCRPRELRVWDLISPKPDWRKTLEALARVSEAVFEQGELTRRVAWYLDMSDGSFARPALQEHRDGQGFSQGQRCSIGELYALRHELPGEDQRVLECTREARDGRRELTPEAHEMLIGHPRVFNGARGNQPVEVARGSCRIETEDEDGHIRVVVEPAGATLGVNVIPESETRLVVYRVNAIMQRVIEALPHGVRIPRAHEPEIHRILGRLSESVEVRSAELAAVRAVDPDGTPCVRIAPRAGAWMVQVGVRPFASEGRFFVAGLGRAGIVLERDGERLRCVRDLAGERARADALIAECPSLNGDTRDRDDAFFLDEAGVLALLSELRVATSAHTVEWPETPLRLAGSVSSKSLHARLRSDKGWYLATGGVRLKDLGEIALEQLVRAPTVGNGRFVRLPNGDYLEIEERVRAVLAALRSTGTRLRPAALSALRELSELADPDAAAFLERADALAAKHYPIPAALNAELRPYQVVGFQWLARLAELGVGACLADDMGLGKTLQLTALLLARAEEGPALVVAPTSVCGNWARELARFAPSLKVVEYDRARSLDALAKGHVLICSYALLQQNELPIDFATAILDEAQFIKNAESLRARAAFRISARVRVVSTGTPVENHYGDLWSLFEFINPGLLGDWPAFKRRFVTPKETGSSDGDGPPEVALRRLVQPYVLRRRKEDVLKELPPLTVLDHEVHLSEQDTLRYGVLRKQIHEKLFTPHGKRHNKLEILAEIGRLRRFCCHPRLVFPDAPGESAKIDTLLELVDELRANGHRALVFSQYVDFLGLVREQLEERAIRYEYLDGGTPAAQRQARVDAFQQGDASLFLISLKAGGFGLNLTAADYVVHLDPWWNPAVQAQATDRAHRIGQTERVTVYRLVTKNTIEEQILALHANKQRLARALLDDEPLVPAVEELETLLSESG